MNKKYTFDSIITVENLLKSFNKCLNGTSWKYSVQLAVKKRSYHIYNMYNQLKMGIIPHQKGKEFIYNERGKQRKIRSVHITERTVQKLLCDELLNPLITPSLIYDNGASLKGKGIKFSRERIKKHLINFYQRNHTNKGYILTVDFQKYFENIDHDILYSILKEKILDEKLLNIVWKYVKTFGDKGLCLGSQISQILAIFYSNRLDHYIKEVLRVKGYGRYMDDSYLLFKTKNEAQEALIKIKEFVQDKGIILHPKKVKIQRIDKGFEFLKGKYFVTDSGKIIVKMTKSSIKRQRVKIKKLLKLAKKRKVSYKDLKNQLASFEGYCKNFNCYKSSQHCKEIYNKTIIEIL